MLKLSILTSLEGEIIVGYIDNNFKYIQSLVGDVNKNDLSCVDVYVYETLGIFIPSIGFCKYAIRPNHIHPSYSFIIFFSESDTDSFIVPSIDVLPNSYLCCALSPNIPHEEPVSENFHRYIAIFINENFFKNQFSYYSSDVDKKYFWTQFTINKSILNYIKSFINEYEDNLKNSSEVLYSLSILITNEIIRSLINSKTNSTKQVNNFEIQKAINYINANFSNKITTQTLCRLTNMSESNFNKHFKTEIGMSPNKYLIDTRIRKAKKFLRNTNLSITDISLKCGFYSASHFSSCFMSSVNLSPTEYQNLFNSK